ncbi:MAG: HAMP domain-containing histidine kinase [Chloroflexi bacterium]|nr:HAMP domain-containing histidine kinase [Chloroflexota bacterium]
MNLLLEDVLTMSKSNAGKLDFRPERVALQAFCEQLWHNVQHLAEKTHPVDFVYDCEVDYVMLDPNLIRCILVNLLSNAIKYSPQDGYVCFEVKHGCEDPVFRVSDNEIGIPEQDQAKLFEPFHRAENVEGIDWD